MPRSHETYKAKRRSERRWAIVRIMLGTAQIMAATFAAVILMSHENDALAIAAGVVTVCLLVSSRVLFRSDRIGR